MAKKIAKMPKGLMNLKEAMMEKSPVDKKSDKKIKDWSSQNKLKKK
jgi:hypothetical protein